MIMKSVIASMIAVAGMAVAANAQNTQMRMLVSADGGATWSASVNAAPGSHVEVLVTVSTTNAAVVGFGSANFQPIVSNWDNTGSGSGVDHLSPLLQGGNTLGSMINAQSNSAGVGTPNPYLTPSTANSGTPVPNGAYQAGTYGRVYPMGRTYLDTPNDIIGFIHTNPPTDQTGRTYAAGTYLRIAQRVTPNWFNAADNNTGGSGVNAAQLFTVGRTTSDPQFWGTGDIAYDPGDPDNGINPTYSFAAGTHTERRSNVQLFRFGIDLSDDTTARTLVVDAPLAGQQLVSTTGTTRYIGFYSSAGSNNPNVTTTFGTAAGNAGVFTGSITVVPVPTPATLALLGLGGMVVGRRRR